MPIPRKPPEISNYQFLCALLYMIENGCKWRALPKKYGKWHTIYMRFNRWSKNGTIKRIFEKMQELNIIDVRTDTLCIDSTSIKVHPDAAGARKSSGEQSIGRSKGGWQRSCICAVPPKNTHLFFTFLPAIVTMHRKDENLSKWFTPKMTMTFLWTEPMKIIKPVL